MPRSSRSNPCGLVIDHAYEERIASIRVGKAAGATIGAAFGNYLASGADSGTRPVGTGLARSLSLKRHTPSDVARKEMATTEQPNNKPKKARVVSNSTNDGEAAQKKSKWGGCKETMKELKATYNQMVATDDDGLDAFMGYVRHERLRGEPTQAEFALVIRFFQADESDPSFLSSQCISVPMRWEMQSSSSD